MTKDKHEYPQILPPDRHVQEAMDIKDHYEKQLTGAKELLDQNAKENARLSEQNEVLAKAYQKEVGQLREELKIATREKKRLRGQNDHLAKGLQPEHERLRTENESLEGAAKKAISERIKTQRSYKILQLENDALEAELEFRDRENKGLAITIRQLENELAQGKPPTPRMVDPAGWMLDPTVPIPVEERRRIAKNYGFVDAELNHSYKSVYIVLIIALTLVVFGVLEVMQ